VGPAKCLLQPSMKTGLVLWFTGLSGSGKSTLAARVAERLAEEGIHVEALDGDEVRKYLSYGLGFSREDRDQNVRRIGFVARLAARSGACAITAAISPYRAIREEIRALTPGFVEVYTECPLEVLAARDPKGLYKKALAGEIKNFTGVDDPYEPPAAPEVHLRTDLQSPEECEAIILARLRELGYLDEQAGQARLAPPYGGELFTVPVRPLDPAAECIEVDEASVAAAVAIGLGYLSPVSGFMPEREAEKVLKLGQLERGFAWPIAQLLLVSSRYGSLAPGTRVVLSASGRRAAELVLHEVATRAGEILLSGPLEALGPEVVSSPSVADVREQARVAGLEHPVVVVEAAAPTPAAVAAALAMSRAATGLILLVPSAHGASWQSALAEVERILVVPAPVYLFQQPALWPMAARNVGGTRLVESLLAPGG